VGRVGGRRQKSSVQAADRRLLKLFRAGYLDRFRPISRRGSFPWTYQLGLEGHRLLQRAGIVGPRERFVRREVYDYGHVLHDLQLNAWVLAYRRAAGLAFLSWDGETHIEPPPEARARQGVLSVGDYWSAERLCDPRARQVRPDAVIEVARPDGDRSRVFFIEFDRIRRVDKNYEKFRRYDSFLCWWWQHTSYADGERPFVIFICQDEDQRDRFLTAADRELTGQLWHPSTASDEKVYIGRRRVIFACEPDMHLGRLEGRQQFFPSLATSGDAVHVAWYDSRLDAPGGAITALDVFYNRSLNAGVSFAPDQRVTDVSHDPNQVGRFPVFCQAFIGAISTSTPSADAWRRSGTTTATSSRH
jgi:hypothetical protein